MKNKTSGSNQNAGNFGSPNKIRRFGNFRPRAMSLAALGFVAAGIIASASSAHAQQAVGWTFEQFTAATGQTAGPYAAEVNNTGGTTAATLSGVGTISAPSGNGSLRSYSANGWTVGGYFQFSLSTTTGATLPVSVSYDQTGSSTGPKDFALFYSTNGTTFTEMGTTYAVAVSTWNTSTVMPGFTHTFDFSSVAGGLENQSTLVFRIVDQDTTSIGNGTVASTGTDRIDNFTVNVPEPTSVLGGTLLIAAACWSQRRRLGVELFA